MTRTSMTVMGAGLLVLSVAGVYLWRHSAPAPAFQKLAAPEASSPSVATSAVKGSGQLDTRSDVVTGTDATNLFQKPFTPAKYEEVRKRFRSSEEAAYGPLTGTHLEYYRDDVAKVLSLTQPLPAEFEDAINGNVDALVRALDAGTPVDSFVTYKTPDQPSMTLLDVAIEAGQREVIRLLLERGADPNPKTIPAPAVEGIGPADPYVQPPPLTLAAGKGEDDVVELLLNRGASLEQGYDPSVGPVRCAAPLCAAIASGSISTAYLLLMHGADVAPLLNSEGVVHPIYLSKSGSQGDAIKGMLRAHGAFLPEGNGF